MLYSPEKFWGRYANIEELKTGPVSPVQPLNANSPIEVTLEGMVTLVNPVQPENAELPIDVTLEGMVTLVNPEHP